MFDLEIKIYKNWLLALSFFLLFGSLSISKGLSTVSEISILILSLDKIFKKSIFNQILEHKTLFVFTIFFLFLIIGLLWTDNVVNGLKIIRHQHRWLVVPLIFMVNIPFLKENYKKLLLTFSITASIAAFLVIVLSVLPTETVISISENVPLLKEYPKTMDRFAFGLYSPFVDRLQFSNLIGLASITILFLLLSKKVSKWYVIQLFPLLYCSIILGGRGGQIALFSGFFVYGLIYIYKVFFKMINLKLGKIGTSLILISSMLIVFTAFSFVLIKTNSQLRTRYNQLQWELTTFYDGTYKNFDYVHFTSVRRIVSWKHLWSVFEDNPILGVGTGDVTDSLSLKYAKDNYMFPVNIHSQYLYILAGWGLIGFLLFFVSWIYWLKSLSKNRILLDFALVFTAFSLISMLTDAVLIKQIDLMAFVVFIVLIGVLNKFENYVGE